MKRLDILKRMGWRGNYSVFVVMVGKQTLIDRPQVSDETRSGRCVPDLGRLRGRAATSCFPPCDKLHTNRLLTSRRPHFLYNKMTAMFACCKTCGNLLLTTHCVAVSRQMRPSRVDSHFLRWYDCRFYGSSPVNHRFLPRAPPDDSHVNSKRLATGGRTVPV